MLPSILKDKADLLQDALTYSKSVYSDDFRDANVYSNSYYSITAALYILDDLDVLAFKGSVELRDWSINAQAIPYLYRGRWSHMGFARAHCSVWRQIELSLDPEKELLITGHSLGGGEAELSANLVRDHVAPVHMITFGKPNVFVSPRKPAMAHLSTQLSVVAGSDIVARIPRMLFGPDPGQDMLYFGNNGLDYLNPPKSLRQEDWKLLELVSDHSMTVYGMRVEKIINDWANESN